MNDYVAVFFNLPFFIPHYASKRYASMIPCAALFIFTAVLIFHWVSISQFHSPYSTCSVHLYL